MALSSSPSKGIVVTVPVLVLSASVAAVFFFLLSSLSSCTCGGGRVPVAGVPTQSDVAAESSGETIRSSAEDVEWVKDQIRVNGLHMQDNVLRKGINPRTRAQQLQDLLEYKGISHYEGQESGNHTALPCPGELLTEEHHSNYGEPLRRQQLIRDCPILSNIEPKQIKVWFQNRICREKQRNESSRLQAVNRKLSAMNKLLIEENDRLQKHVSQLVCENGYMCQQLHTLMMQAATLWL